MGDRGGGIERGQTMMWNARQTWDHWCMVYGNGIGSVCELRCAWFSDVRGVGEMAGWEMSVYGLLFFKKVTMVSLWVWGSEKATSIVTV